MGKTVTVSIPHGLGQEEARRRIAEGFASMQRRMSDGLIGVLSFRERWEGDRLHFEGGALGQTICGRLDVLADSVQIQVDVPEMLAAIANRIVATLKQETQKLLGKK
jgi:hypothetical protein